MKKIAVRDLLALSPAPPHVVSADESVRRVGELMIADRATREVYLVDERKVLLGVITLRRLARHAFSHAVPGQSATEMLDLSSARNAGDLAHKKAAFVGLDDTLDDVLEVMFRSDIEEVPVVDEHRVVVGGINMLDLVAAWNSGRLAADVGP